MGDANDFGDLSSEMEVDAFRRLFPLRFHERHISESIRPDAKSLGKARETILELGAVASADGSALAKIGFTLYTYRIHKSFGTDDITIPDVERILKAKIVAAVSLMAPGGIYTSSQESQNQLVVAAGR